MTRPVRTWRCWIQLHRFRRLSEDQLQCQDCLDKVPDPQTWRNT